MNIKSIAVVFVLGVMLVLMLFSAAGDSATMDELAHIPAGFGYVKMHDYRLNPEHPPLIKALSAYSAWLFAKPYFPTNTEAWQKDINGQWTQGTIFLYESDNDADKIIFWSRFPLILLTIFLGGLLFWWTRNKFGENTALLTLILYAFSPTVLAHGRYVTTDLGASFGFFIGLIAFLKFIEKPVWKNIVLAGLSLGLALLLKFSLVLLIPVFLAVIFVKSWGVGYKYLFSMAGKTILAGLVAILLVWITYFFFNYNYPQDRQLSDAKFLLASHPNKPLAEMDLWLMKNEATRHLGQYLLGFLMVSQRAGGGNTGYFLGEVSASGWRYYFPVLYLLKETLAFHLLTLLAMALWLIKILRSKNLKVFKKIGSWANNINEFSFLALIIIYWASSMISPLNIGIRHVLPTFPFIYILVSKKITEWFRSKNFKVKRIIVAILVAWMVAGTAKSFPGFLSYYNELAGGTKNGYKIAVDSNYDWGQDLKRLKKFVEQNNIEKIAVDYFGGGNLQYYLGDKFEPWHSALGVPTGDQPKWLAVSATFRQGAYGAPVPGFERKPEDSYLWLKNYEPVARAGKSIFIYRLP
ncbi:MAG: phospholipid carrier-dependent glycosyltransferase [bacterium]|nr:phospholipid carrier-dependent glycosyltransferase [bacterium]